MPGENGDPDTCVACDSIINECNQCEWDADVGDLYCYECNDHYIAYNPKFDGETATFYDWLVLYHTISALDQPWMQGPFQAAEGTLPSDLGSFCAMYYSDENDSEAHDQYHLIAQCNPNTPFLELLPTQCADWCENGQGPSRGHCTYCSAEGWNYDPASLLAPTPPPITDLEYSMNVGVCIECDFLYDEPTCIWCPPGWFTVPFDPSDSDYPNGCVPDCDAYGGIEVSQEAAGYEMQIDYTQRTFNFDSRDDLEFKFCKKCPDGCALEDCKWDAGIL